MGRSRVSVHRISGRAEGTMRKVLHGLLILGWIPTLLVAGGARWATARPTAAERTPVKVTRMFTGPDGKTHAEEIQVPLGAALGAGRGTARGASERSEPISFTDAQFVRTSTTYELDWH